jgi:alpha-L-arabinofuranosidase
VLFQSDFANGIRGWRIHGGTWQVREDAICQSGGDPDCRATAGNQDWTDYTYSLKARKTGGKEGFLIVFHEVDSDNLIWWNVGGWGNSRTALEACRNSARSELGQSAPVTVEKDRWYDIRIELKGRNIRCFIDDKLVSEATDAAPPPALYATASRDSASGDVIVKVVNFGGVAQQIELDLQGLPSVDPTATAEVLAGAPQDVNSVAEPEKVASKRMAINNVGARFVHEFPANSVSVLRFKTPRPGASPPASTTTR